MLRIRTSNEDRIQKKNDTFVISSPTHTHCLLASNEAAEVEARELVNRAAALANTASTGATCKGVWETYS